jgi:cyclopropane fatty-acyl-phospholipid synthase-like methyltransferase
MQKILIIFLIIMLYVILNSLFKIACYNFWNGKPSQENYSFILNKLDNNSKILDVGVGTGYNLVQNKEIIKNKNLIIHGIDIDKDYNKYCKNLIKDNGLDLNIFIELKDLFKINYKYDYIIFGQSFPVIERNLMTRMLNHAIENLKDDGKIIFIHSLVDDYKDIDNIFYKIKPYIKYIPFIWLDSGKKTTKFEFENWLENNNLRYNYYITRYDKFFNMKINTYAYICSPIIYIK